MTRPDTPAQKQQQQYRQGNIQNSGSRQQGTDGGGQLKATSEGGKKKVTKSNSQSAAGPNTSGTGSGGSKTVVTKQASVTRSGL